LVLWTTGGYRRHAEGRYEIGYMDIQGKEEEDTKSATLRNNVIFLLAAKEGSCAIR
jgi:hypothetical protein